MEKNKNTYQLPQANSNFIMISRTNILPIQSQPSCKICLQKGSDMISPCLCQGSLQFVHENCIKQWLQYQLENKNEFGEIKGSIYQKCEICKQQIGFSYVDRKYCSYHAFFLRAKTKKAKLFSDIIALFVLMTALGGLLYLFIKSLMESNSTQITIVIFIFQTLLLIGFILILAHLIFVYFISREILICRVLNKNKMVNG